MRTAIVTLMILAIAGSAIAADLGATRDQKISSTIQYQNPVEHKQGGDTIFDAFVIPGLPFNDTGTTFGYVDDYDEVCPYTGSTSPDVVYSFTPADDINVLIDLCGSLYDTKLYVYDASLVQVACNDDFYFDDLCGVYVSAIEDLPLTGGMQYYIVIDGYGGESGDYVLAVEGFIPPEPCEIEIPDGVINEGEGPLPDGYVDMINGGCNSVPEVYSLLTVPEDGCTTVWGIGGFYDAGSFRDTDWYEFTAPTDVLGIKFQGENEFDIYLLNTDCGNIQVIDTFSVGDCDPFVEVSMATVPGTLYHLFVGVQFDSGTLNNYDYLMSLCGYDVVGTVSETWGGVKSLYR